MSGGAKQGTALGIFLTSHIILHQIKLSVYKHIFQDLFQLLVLCCRTGAKGLNHLCQRHEKILLVKYSSLHCDFFHFSGL